MGRKHEDQFANIEFQIDEKELTNIAESGRLEEFVSRATELFGRDLRAKLEAESVSSLSTALFLIDDEFGTGPRPPLWNHIARTDALIDRLGTLEAMLIREVK